MSSTDETAATPAGLSLEYSDKTDIVYSPRAKLFGQRSVSSVPEHRSGGQRRTQQTNSDVRVSPMTNSSVL